MAAPAALPQPFVRRIANLALSGSDSARSLQALKALYVQPAIASLEDDHHFHDRLLDAELELRRCFIGDNFTPEFYAYEQIMLDFAEAVASAAFIGGMVAANPAAQLLGQKGGDQ